MGFSKKLIISSVFFVFIGTGNVLADDVFLKKQRAGHELSGSERR